MRYIDRTGKKMGEAGDSRNITCLKGLTTTACAKAEHLGLGVMKTSWGAYKVIRASGLGFEAKAFGTLEEIDAYIKRI